MVNITKFLCYTVVMGIINFAFASPLATSGMSVINKQWIDKIQVFLFKRKLKVPLT